MTEQEPRPARTPDPVTLVFAAPSIDGDEHWRERSRVSWAILAEHEVLDVRVTDDGPQKGRSSTWCGNVLVDGDLYEVHRGSARDMRMTGMEPTLIRPVAHRAPVPQRQ